MMQRNAFIRYVRGTHGIQPGGSPDRKPLNRKKEWKKKKMKKHGLSACTRKSIREKK